MNSLFSLVYTSKSVTKIDEELIKNILRVARKLNQRDQITGLLVAREDYFLQLLEGDEDTVQACFARIRADRRHSQIVLQGSCKITERHIPDWNMALFKSQGVKNTSEDLLALFEAGRRGEVYTDPKSLESLLRLFSKNAEIIN